jgi:hypothetical protein
MRNINLKRKKVTTRNVGNRWGVDKWQMPLLQIITDIGQEQPAFKHAIHREQSIESPIKIRADSSRKEKAATASPGDSDG